MENIKYYTIFTIFIVAILTIFVMVSDLEISTRSVFYPIETWSEWGKVNLLTPATDKKQKLHTKFAGERVDDLLDYALESSDIDRLQYLLRNYRSHLQRGEYMMEKLLFLEGSQLPGALDYEFQTREFEQKFVRNFKDLSGEQVGIFREAIITTQNYNQKMFVYMVVNYQFTDEDIAMYSDIVESHIAFVEEMLSQTNRSEYQSLFARQDESIVKARDFLSAGLNIEAYQEVVKAKNVMLSVLFQESFR